MPKNAIKSLVTRVDDTAQYDLGSEWEQEPSELPSTLRGSGGRVWVYVQNGEASNPFAIGNPIIRKVDATTKVGIISAAAATPAMRVMGVAQHAIAAGKYGWILRRGPGLLKGEAAGVAKTNAVVVGTTTAGTVQAVAAATDGNAIGYLHTALGASATGLGWINCSG